jgi:transposase
MAQGAVLTNKGYDAGYIVDDVAAMGAEAVVPPRSNHREKRGHDRARYRERNRIGRMAAQMKQFRGMVAKYAKLAAPFMSFAHLVAVLLWPK